MGFMGHNVGSRSARRLSKALYRHGRLSSFQKRFQTKFCSFGLASSTR